MTKKRYEKGENSRPLKSEEKEMFGLPKEPIGDINDSEIASIYQSAKPAQFNRDYSMEFSRWFWQINHKYKIKSILELMDILELNREDFQDLYNVMFGIEAPTESLLFRIEHKILKTESEKKIMYEMYKITQLAFKRAEINAIGKYI